MQEFDITIGADVRAYCRQTMQAESREVAIAKAIEWLQMRGHTPEAIGFHIIDEEGSAVQGDVSISATESGEDMDDNWYDLPSWDGQPRFAALRAERDNLLTALQIALPALEWCDKQWRDSHQYGEGINVHALVRATIAKAEGTGPVPDTQESIRDIATRFAKERGEEICQDCGGLGADPDTGLDCSRCYGGGTVAKSEGR